MLRLLAVVLVLCFAIVQPVGAAAPVTDRSEIDTNAQEQTDSYPPLPTEAFAGEYFVTQQYRDMLGRDPDQPGLSYWVAQLDAGTEPAEFIAQLVESPEFGAVRIPVARLYQAALGRLPESGGWQYWSARLSSGESLDFIAAALINTPEGHVRLPQGDADAFVEALYHNVLERPADPAGLAFWQGRLRGGQSMASVVVDFAQSLEFANRLDPQIRASLLYEGLLNRSAEPEGLAFWSSELVAGRSYVSSIGAFINRGEYEQRLQTLWCDVITLDEALDWTDNPEGRQLDERYQQSADAAQHLVETVGDGEVWPDEVTVIVLDSKPQNSLVIGVHQPTLAEACLPILASAPHPEVLQFAPTPFLTSELEEKRQAIGELAGPKGVEATGSGRGRLNVWFSASALPVAEQILTEFGDAMETFTVGAFPYPMPTPLPDPVCHLEPDSAIDASELGLTITLDLPTSVVSGGVASGTFTVTNTGTGTYTLYWGYEVTGYLGSGTMSQSVFTGSRFLPLTAPTLGPGESTTGRLDIGTAACDPAGGHALSPGDYQTWGSISLVDHSVQDPSIEEPTHALRLPAIQLTLTD